MGFDDSDDIRPWLIKIRRDFGGQRATAASAIFNTIIPPSSTQYPFGVVRKLGQDQWFERLRRAVPGHEQQPPRRLQLPVRRRQRALSQVVDLDQDVLGARDQGQRRDRVVGQLLIRRPARREPRMASSSRFAQHKSGECLVVSPSGSTGTFSATEGHCHALMNKATHGIASDSPACGPHARTFGLAGLATAGSGSGLHLHGQWPRPGNFRHHIGQFAAPHDPAWWWSLFRQYSPGKPETKFCTSRLPDDLAWAPLTVYPIAPALVALPFVAPQVALLDFYHPGWDRDRQVLFLEAILMAKRAMAAVVGAQGSCSIACCCPWAYAGQPCRPCWRPVWDPTSGQSAARPRGSMGRQLLLSDRGDRSVAS